VRGALPHKGGELTENLLSLRIPGPPKIVGQTLEAVRKRWVDIVIHSGFPSATRRKGEKKNDTSSKMAKNWLKFHKNKGKNWWDVYCRVPPE
jgi:hypothetical protein